MQGMPRIQKMQKKTKNEEHAQLANSSKISKLVTNPKLQRLP